MSEQVLPSIRLREANRGLSALVLLSLAGHGLALAAIVYFQAWQPPLDIARRSMPVELVQLGKPRDPKLLPRKVEPPPPPPPPPDDAVALETKTPKEERAPEPRPKKEKKEEKRELSAAAKRLLANSDRLDKALSRIEEREGQENGYEQGTTTDATNAATGYAADVLVALKKSYHLPETIPVAERATLEARVLLYIQRDGSIRRYEFVKRHPNEAFMAALESALKSVKLPPPPADAVTALKDGIEIVFNNR